MGRSILLLLVFACATAAFLSSGVCANPLGIDAVALSPLGDKRDADGASESLTDMVVTATFPNFCYLENEGRTWGILAESPDGGYPDPGTKVEVRGTMLTNSDGERYLLVDDGNTTGSGTIAPLGVTNRDLGGGDWNYDPANHTGQMGVTGGMGLNNIGLLVRTTGACTYIDDHTFTIDDGSDVNVRCETPPTIFANPAWQYIAVTGISTIQKTGETYSRLLGVMKVEPITSGPPDGITGRWEMTTTSGDMAGVFGMLLVQNGSAVTGSMRGITLIDGQISGNTFTGTFVVDSDSTVLSSMTFDGGDTLTGTWSQVGRSSSFNVTFHRVSPEPVSPYVGRPQVLSATCNGWSINVTWDRPINGWDYDIRLDNGQSITDWAGTGNTYNPDTHVFHLPLHTTTPLVPGTHYTIYLDSGDSVDWHDPYGAAAWDYVGDAYSFDYTYQQLPPTPGYAYGWHAPGMPAQWVTISSTWPPGCSLKLYQSADHVLWYPTTITPTRRGNFGDFTFELWSNAYFSTTAVGASSESIPSATIHARPFETETNGIIIDAPTEGATSVSLTPTISWHPAWLQPVTLQRYGPKVIDVATGGIPWSPLTNATPPQTSLVYGQTNGVLGTQATPLAYNKAYALRIGAFDSENWMFAYSAEDHFTTAAAGALSVISAYPPGAPNTGALQITDLSGTNFASGAAAKLTRPGQPDIAATGVSVQSSTKITCNFDLTGAATGLWSITVTNPGGQSATLANKFAVMLPDTAPMVGCANKAIADTTLLAASKFYRIKVWGKVTTIVANSSFLLDDGSGAPVTVFSPNYLGFIAITDGDYASAMGTLNSGVPPLGLLCYPPDITKLTDDNLPPPPPF